uniref:Uncharacterized protein n=1 Tax=Pristionchus pacificus TaxID=54126 RepID=A0A2A6D171_PRIPA|eukprot:PDM84204.1 hypothetical protein PRIPAC_33227 [Pristionchus pacificus]
MIDSSRHGNEKGECDDEKIDPMKFVRRLHCLLELNAKENAMEFIHYTIIHDVLRAKREKSKNKVHDVIYKIVHAHARTVALRIGFGLHFGILFLRGLIEDQIVKL